MHKRNGKPGKRNKVEGKNQKKDIYPHASNKRPIPGTKDHTPGQKVIMKENEYYN
jgi:hypothetical protein